MSTPSSHPPLHLVVWHTEGTAISGIFSWMWRLKKQLPADGIRLTLVSLEIQPFRFAQVCDASAFYDMRIRSAQEFLAFLKKNKTAIHLINHAYPYVDLVEELSPGMASRLKLVGICHSDQDYYYSNLQRLDSKLKGIIAVSPVCQLKLERLLPHRAGTIPSLPAWNIPVPQAPPVRDWQSLRPLRVLFNGRLLQVQKRVLDLPEISRCLAHANTPAELTVVGDGPDADKLKEAFSHGKHVPHSFLEARPPWEMNELLHSHDIFLQISEFEGASVSLMEAMAEGLIPVVTATDSGIDLLKHKENALLSPIADAPAIAANIALITDLRKFGEQLSEQSFRTASRYLEQLDYSTRLRQYLSAI
jgi:glycosyltransferase involved in cell wall biosynthesis